MEDTESIQILDHEPNPPRRGRAAIAVVAAALVIVALLAALLSNRSGSTPRASQLAPSVRSATTGTPATSATTATAATTEAVEVPETTEDDLDDTEQWHGFEEGERASGPAPAPEPEPDGEPVELDPVGDPAPTGPCAALAANGSSLVVGPDPLVLDAGKLSGALTVVNCGNAIINWTASTKPSVSLGVAAGSTSPGQSANLPFTIESDEWEPGAVDFSIKVSEPGHNHYVDVHAFRPTFGKDVVGGNGSLSGGPDAGGCANQCITKALLQPNMSTPNVSLDIATNTPAKIRVWVSKNAPNVANNVPSFPGNPAPMATSAANVKSYLAKLAPLSAATKYHVIVKATDANDKSSYRTGSFTTIDPVKPGNLAEPGGPSGCATQCITTALVSAGGDHTVKHLKVVTHTAARMQVRASTAAPKYTNGAPGFEKSDVWVNSGLEYKTSWDTDLTGLAGSTKYHVIVQATDNKDRTSYRVGQFQTPAPPMKKVSYAPAAVHIVYDGDKGINRGEVSFAFIVDGQLVSTRGEHKQSDGDTIHYGKTAHVVAGVVDMVPTAYLVGFERDADGLVEFCSMGPDQTTPGHDGSCDLQWNVADTGLTSLAALEGLPSCTSLGAAEQWAGDRCMSLTSTDAGGVRFTALVAVGAS